MSHDTTTVKTEIPARLHQEMLALVSAGWFRDVDQILSEALRRYLESHRPELMERHVMDDVEWGIRGSG
jgi:hypothetical protein